MLLLCLRMIALVASLTPVARSQPFPQTFFPASIPLAIRSPYMSIWYNSTNDAPPLSNSWPLFWGRQNVLDLQGSIRVDGQTYLWTGVDRPAVGVPSANVTSVRITPTRTIFVMQAGPMNVTITYLSPIEPSDWVLQSLPFSYVSVETTSLDDAAHDVQVYSEISGGWLSSDGASSIQWIEYSTESGTVVHNVQLQAPQKYVEINQQAQDGQAYFAMALRPGLTWQIARDIACRSLFHDTGHLNSTRSTTFRSIGKDVPVFAIAVDLGEIKSTTSPVTWAVGYVRNPSIAYTGPDGSTQDLMPYYTTRYPGPNITQAIDDLTAGFPDIAQRAVALDNAILGDALKISEQYADLVSLAARQVLGSLDITVSTGADGKPNASDVRVFMKDIGSSTSTGRVNPVEQIYGALPLLLHFNASLVGPLLAPLLDAQDGLAGQPYAAQDIGLAYPKATGTRGAHDRGVEQTGNMLIMLYAHARFTGDGTLLSKHYDLAKRWANYLVNTSLVLSDQTSADSQIKTGANLTNLALKGVIGVKAMAEICQALGQQDDAQLYEDHAAALASSWKSLASSPDGTHLLGAFGEPQSWALMYNIYADRLLGTGVVSQEMLQGQTSFYKTLLGASPKFGLPISSDAAGTANAAWLLFTAATVLDDDVRDGLIQGAWNRASFNQTTGPFPAVYNSGTGAMQGGPNANAAPSFGAMFSLLALNLPNKTIVALQPPDLRDNGKSGGNDGVPVGIIVGTVAGGVACIVLVGLGVWVIRRRHRHFSLEEQEKADASGLSPSHLSPYLLAKAPRPPSALSSTLSSIDPSGTSVMAMGSESELLPSRPHDDPMVQRRTSFGKRPRNSQPTGPPPRSRPTHMGLNAGQPLVGEATQGHVPDARGGRSVPASEVVGLRTEIEQLRRDMLDMRRENDTLPEYPG